MQTPTSAEPVGLRGRPYENWRPPILWAAVLVRVEQEHLLLNDISGRGDLVLPGTLLTARQAPTDAG